MKRLFVSLIVAAFAVAGVSAQTTGDATPPAKKIAVAHLKRSDMKTRLMNNERLSDAKKRELRAKIAEKPGGKAVAIHKLHRKHAKQTDARSGKVTAVPGKKGEKKVAVRRASMDVE